MQQFFILGNPRSGTSLLRLILNNHHKIVVPPESGFLLWWSKKYSDWTRKNSMDSIQVDGFVKDIKSSKKIETWGLDYDILKNRISKTLPDNYLQLCQQIYLTYAAQKSKEPTIIGDKNNYYIQHLTELAAIAPKAKYLHIIRDGRDVACSYKALAELHTESQYKPVLPTDVSSIAKEWVHNNNEILKFSEMISSSNFLTIRYEDMIANTEDTTKLLCKFFNVPFDPNMLLYYESNRINNEEPIKTLDWKLKTLEEPDKGNINKYKHLLSSQEVEEFNRIGEKLLSNFRYEY